MQTVASDHSTAHQHSGTGTVAVDMLFWTSNQCSNRCKSAPITSSHKTEPWNNVALLCCGATFLMRRDGSAQQCRTVILLWQDDGGHFRLILARISLLQADRDGSCVDNGHSVMAPAYSGTTSCILLCQKPVMKRIYIYMHISGGTHHFLALRRR